MAHRLDNAHLLKPFEQTRKRDYPYIVFEFIESQTLNQWMTDKPNPCKRHDGFSEFVHDLRMKLPSEVSGTLQEFPHKSWGKVIATDPVIYRWYEIVGVYGETIKELSHKKFGVGIMSAIDFTMHFRKEEIPAGDRLVVKMSGKFLPDKKLVITFPSP